ncbi:MAG: toll/interleukin-1 receptor domain-containing protein [bacterium]|nr:toll/interleukin-1 receptor domain-containing protein [bacterium]
MPDPESPPTPVFVSYSHRDKKWLERLQVHLKPLLREGDIDLWDDTRIQPGADWKAEIDRALAGARVAVFLVSPDFLASDFIHDEELPALLEAAEKRGTRILPVILSHCLYADSRLGRFQAANSPDRPLEGLAKAGRDKVLSDLARAIAVGLSAEAPARVSTEPKPASNQKGAGGACKNSVRKNPPSPSPEKRRAEHQSLATRVFGGLLLLFLFGVFIFAPATLPEYKHRILAVCAALLAGLFGWFLSGDIGVHIEALKSRFGNVAIRATGGLALFVLVLVWWLSPLAPVTSTVPEAGDGGEIANTGSAAVGTGIATTGSQTIKGSVTITGGSSSVPAQTPAGPGSASAGTGIANTGNQLIEGPVTIGAAPGKEQR